MAHRCTWSPHPHAVFHSVWGDQGELGPQNCPVTREVWPASRSPVTHAEFYVRLELSVLLLPPLCFPAVTFRMNSLHLVQTLKALQLPLPGRSMAQGKGREDRADTAIASLGDTSSAPGLLPKAPSCSARFSGAFTALAVPGQPEASAPASAGTAGLRDGQQPSPGSHHGWVPSEGRHRREQGTWRCKGTAWDGLGSASLAGTQHPASQVQLQG